MESKKLIYSTAFDDFPAFKLPSNCIEFYGVPQGKSLDPIKPSLYTDVYTYWLPNLTLHTNIKNWVLETRMLQWLPTNAYHIFETLMIEYNIPSRKEFQEKYQDMIPRVLIYYEMAVIMTLYCSVVLYYGNLSYDLLIEQIQRQNYIFSYILDQIEENYIKKYGQQDYIIGNFETNTLDKFSKLIGDFKKHVNLLSHFDYDLSDNNYIEKLDTLYDSIYFVHFAAAKMIINTYIHGMSFVVMMRAVLEMHHLNTQTITQKMNMMCTSINNHLKDQSLIHYIIYESYMRHDVVVWNQLGKAIFKTMKDWPDTIASGHKAHDKLWKELWVLGLKPITLPLI